MSRPRTLAGALRRRAEAVLSGNHEEASTIDTAGLKKLVHELQVHQIELEMQNEQLRQAQLELADSRDAYAELYDLAPVGYLTLDRSGTIVEVNQTAAVMLGVDRSALVRSRLSDFVRPDAQDDWFRHRRLLLSGEAKRSIELPLYRGDGVIVVARIESVPRLGETAGAWRCMTALSDVTEQRRADERLRLQAGILDQVSDAVIAVDGERRVTYLNHEAEQRYRVSARESYGRPLGELHAIRWLRPEDEAVMLAALAERGLWRGENIHVTRGGRAVFVESTVTVFRDERGAAIGLLTTIRDITERKHAEGALLRLNEELEQRVRERTAKLAESEEKFRTLAEQSPNMIFIHQRGRIAYVNPACQRVIGCDPLQIQAGLSFGSLIAPDSRELVRSRIEHLERDEETPRCELVLVAGDQRIEAILSTRLIDYGGDKAILGVLTDITSRKKAERLRLDQQKRLRRLSAKLASAQEDEQRRISEGLHDDVAQVLAACSLKLGVAENAATAAEQRAVHDEIDELLSEATEKVRSLSFELSSATLYRAGVGDAIEELCRSLTGRYGVRFALSGTRHASRLNESVETVLFRAVRELLFNVVKHAGVAEASVSVCGDGRNLRLTVEDFGRGFEGSGDEDRGLGLFWIRERLRDVGGRMRVESEPGAGTRVTLWAPAAARPGRVGRGSAR